MNTFKLDTLKPFYADPGQDSRSVAAELKTDRTFRRRVLTRSTKQLLHVANAAKALDRLPEIAESIHIVAKGNFAAWDFVPAVLRLAEPATILRLDVATLGFSRKGAAELASLMDAGKVGEVSFVYSVYFRDSSADESDFLIEQLVPRGAKVAAVRSHAKLLCFELSDGRNIVIETSANLRSCRNIEQYSISNDRDLLLFHRSWLEDVIEEANS